MTTTFFIRPTCKLTGIDPNVVYRGVKTGWLKPIKLGSAGRGNNHEFTARQLLGLTFVAAMYDDGHPCSCCAGMWMRWFEKMTDSDVRNFISGKGPCCTGFADEFLEEKVEELRARGRSELMTNESSRLNEDIAQRLQRVGPVVLAALDDSQPDFGEGKGTQVKDREEIVKQMSEAK